MDHDTDPALRQLCDDLDRLPEKDMAARLCTAILEHEGEMLLPSLDTAAGRAGFGFKVFGISVAGHTQRAAAELWRCTARTAIGGYSEPAGPGDMVLRQAQLRWIRSVVMIRATPDLRRSWACLVSEISNDTTLLSHARAILRADQPTATAAE